MSRAGRNALPKPFTGILAEPLDIPNALLIASQAYGQPQAVSEAICRAFDGYVDEQKQDRLIALAKRYGVGLLKGGPYPALEVLLKLAEDVCPGFQTKGDHRRAGPVGAPPGRNFEDNLSLFALIEHKLSKGTISALEACDSISKDRKSIWHGKRPEALYARYTRFQKLLQNQLPHKLAAQIAEIKRVKARGT